MAEDELSDGIPEVLTDEDEDEEAGERPYAELGSEPGCVPDPPGAFSSPAHVFVVSCLSRAASGFRPSVMCEGHLAEIKRSPTGAYELEPKASDHTHQQLSFKYEPPSPKFGRKHPGCLSYRLQLLSGSQFLTSLRGLPRAVRLHRAARALEWGPVHVVFARGADMEAFLGALRYVEVVEVQGEVAEGQQGQQQAAAGEAGGWLWAKEAASLWLEEEAGQPAGSGHVPHVSYGGWCSSALSRARAAVGGARGPYSHISTCLAAVGAAAVVGAVAYGAAVWLSRRGAAGAVGAGGAAGLGAGAGTGAAANTRPSVGVSTSR